MAALESQVRAGPRQRQGSDRGSRRGVAAVSGEHLASLAGRSGLSSNRPRPGSGRRARHAGTAGCKLPQALFDARGAGDDRAVFSAQGCRRAQGARPVLRRRHQAGTPTSSTPISPRPSWPSTSRTTPWPPRRCGRRPRRPPTDPRFHYLLARAFSDDDRARSDKALAEALKINPAPCRQPAAPGRPPDRRRAVRGGREGARTGRSRSTRTSPGPGPTGRCWPTSRNDRDGRGRGTEGRSVAWATNPEVDHLIGRKLSQKYRFAEGAAYQRRALALDSGIPARQGPALPGPAPAGRGGRRAGSSPTRSSPRTATTWSPTTWSPSATAWPGFRTLEDDGFVVRMEPREADLYGPRVLALLRRAQKTLCARSTA